MNAPNVVIVGRNSYKDILEQAWQKHLAPRAKDAPTVISTFAGCGGSSLGYSMAGFKELLAIEWDKKPVETFKLNFPDVPIWCRDIAEISADEILQACKLKPGELDVLDGSPPCQGFSTAGKRKLEDGRNQLFHEFVRLLDGLKPKVFVMENVSGMVKGKMKLIFAEILRELKACSYRVSARLLNAAYFNVPQTRCRLILVGIQDKLEGIPSYPRVEHYPLTAGQAIDGIDSGFVPVSKGKWHNVARLLALGQTGEAIAGKGHGFGLQKLHPDKPSPTIRKLVTACGWSSLYHYAEWRPLGTNEIKLLGSFPLGFQFAGDWKAQWAQIGNSVPPLFMEAIAQHIKEKILESINISDMVKT